MCILVVWQLLALPVWLFHSVGSKKGNRQVEHVKLNFEVM
jgi:hypothetical protein